MNNYSLKCKYSNECPVYNEKLTGLISSNLVLRNVFCKRGAKGWNNCKRYCNLEKGMEVSEIASPYNG